MIPFKYGTIVSGKDFCGRRDLLKQIRRYIESSQRIVVLGERRVGKSSAVCEAVKRSKIDTLLYVDLLGIKSIDGLCKRILRAIVVSEEKSGWMEKAVKALSHLRPSISVDPITLMPTISFDASIEMKANSITEVLSLVESLGRKKRLVTVFDEFQDILNVEDNREALALLRSSIQFHEDISYVFVGSIRHKMDQIFMDHDSPFFKSAIPIAVEPLPFDEFSNFLANRFETGGRRIREGVLEKVFEIADDIPGDIQQLCEALWEMTPAKKTAGPERLKDALELIFSREQKSYENYVNLMTSLQFRCLMALAKQGGKGVSSVSFMKAGGFSNASSVRRAIGRLMKINIVFQRHGEYKFINPFFRAWLLSRG